MRRQKWSLQHDCKSRNHNPDNWESIRLRWQVDDSAASEVEGEGKGREKLSSNVLAADTIHPVIAESNQRVFARV